MIAEMARQPVGPQNRRDRREQKSEMQRHFTPAKNSRCQCQIIPASGGFSITPHMGSAVPYQLTPNP